MKNNRLLQILQKTVSEDEIGKLSAHTLPHISDFNRSVILKMLQDKLLAQEEISEEIQECLCILLRISAILPEAISDGELTPTTDTDLLLATYRGGSHLTSDITALKIFSCIAFHTPDHGGPSSPGTRKDSLPSSRITGATATFFICGIYGCSNQYAFF